MLTRPILTTLAALFLAAAPQGPLSALEARLETTAPDDLKSALGAASLSLAAARAETPVAQDIVAAAQADYRTLLALLYRRGHYGPTISITLDGREASALSPAAVPARIDTIVVRVDPGPLFRFGAAEIAPLAPATGLPDAFAPGEPAESETVRAAVLAAVDAWRDLGHAKAEPSAQRITADHRTAILDARVTLDPGPRLAFGTLTVDGNQRVRAERILEIAGLRPGRVFSPEDLRAAARRLRNTGAFRSVALAEAERPNPDGTLDIAATVVEEPPRRFGFGAEISSLEGLTVSGYWLHRNLLGGAERLRFDARIAGIAGTGSDYKLAASFARPGTFAAANTLTAFAEIAQLDEPDYFSRQVTAELGLLRELSERATVTAGLRYRYAEVRDDLGERSFSLVFLPITGQLDARDVPLDPRQGYFLRLEASPFLSLDGAVGGARAFADGRGYYSFGETSRVTLAGRLQAGSVFGALIPDVPPDLLFHSGGGGTVRGHAYQALGVELSPGVTTGGRSFLGASAELRVRTGERLSVVGFADFGAVGPGSIPGADARSHAGAGLGLRYQTPVGPIRLDVAVPVTGESRDAYQLYIGIGQAF